MRSQRIPDTDSIEELARFWDSHDLTDFKDQLEEIHAPVFVREKEATFAIALTPEEVQVLRRIARSQGVKEPTLMREWVCERLRGILSKKTAEQTNGADALWIAKARGSFVTSSQT